MNSLEALDKMLGLILEYSYWVEAHDLVKIIKQDLERLQQLEIADKNNANLVKTNVDFVNKNLALQKDNNSLQGLLDTTKEDYINIRLENEELLKEIQNLKEDLNLTTIERTNLEDKWYKEHLKCCELEKENNELKDQIAYLKEENENWQSAYEWSQSKNSILKLENQELMGENKQSLIKIALLEGSIKNLKLNSEKVIQENEKLKKAIEIIKNKPQNELALIQLGIVKTYEEYLKYTDKWDVGYGDMEYTQQEYDLLNEVLE